LHWPCVTDNSGITTYGLTASEREMGTRLYPVGVWHTLPLPLHSFNGQYDSAFYCNKRRWWWWCW